MFRHVHVHVHPVVLQEASNPVIADAKNDADLSFSIN